MRHGFLNTVQPLVPIMACWDDHDYGYNDAGSDYPCGLESQVGWTCYHVSMFSVRRSGRIMSTSLPVNPSILTVRTSGTILQYSVPLRVALRYEVSVQLMLMDDDYRLGVYNSRMFSKPGSEENGIHVILLDNRSGRDPTYSKFGECRGSETRILLEEQWTWLEQELERESEIKIIGSGVQVRNRFKTGSIFHKGSVKSKVLPPTNQITRDLTEFCAHDSHNKEETSTTTFLDAIRRVGESDDWYGVPYEMWGEVPLERERLLGLVQRALNRGKTKVSAATGRD